MSREIRRVPPNWQHPRYEPDDRSGRTGQYRPLYDEAFDTVMVSWWQEASAWIAQVRRGETPADGWYPETDEQATWARANPLRAYAEWVGNPPDPESYRDVFTVEPTAYQIYETVTEGTPVSPVFPTEEALVAWCQQAHPETHWPALSEQAARRFVTAGYAPSMVLSPEFGLVSNAQLYEHVAPPDRRTGA
ncbi:MAG TPA: hypothetical protein VMV29_19835 [Ktedonobacterales bacterium]|nr:hypothetical protein [Ktedonobacterales bacterium]